MATLGQYNLDEMTAQEAFEASAIHLLEQSKKSDFEGSCRYDGGCVCCAAAIFIQDYISEMEGATWNYLVENRNQSESHRYLVHVLQRIHDLHHAHEWLEKLKMLPAEPLFGLDSSFLNGWSWSEEKRKYIKEQ